MATRAFFENKRWLIYGKLERPKEELTEAITSRGGRVTGSVSAKLDYLVWSGETVRPGEKKEVVGVKPRAALRAGAAVIGEADLNALLAGEVPDGLQAPDGEPRAEAPKQTRKKAQAKAPATFGAVDWAQEVARRAGGLMADGASPIRRELGAREALSAMWVERGELEAAARLAASLPRESERVRALARIARVEPSARPALRDAAAGLERPETPVDGTLQEQLRALEDWHASARWIAAADEERRAALESAADEALSTLVEWRAVGELTLLTLAEVGAFDRLSETFEAIAEPWPEGSSRRVDLPGGYATFDWRAPDLELITPLLLRLVTVDHPVFEAVAARLPSGSRVSVVDRAGRALTHDELERLAARTGWLNEALALRWLGRAPDEASAHDPIWLAAHGHLPTDEAIERVMAEGGDVFTSVSRLAVVGDAACARGELEDAARVRDAIDQVLEGGPRSRRDPDLEPDARVRALGLRASVAAAEGAAADATAGLEEAIRVAASLPGRDRFAESRRTKLLGSIADAALAIHAPKVALAAQLATKPAYRSSAAVGAVVRAQRSTPQAALSTLDRLLKARDTASQRGQVEALCAALHDG